MTQPDTAPPASDTRASSTGGLALVGGLIRLARPKHWVKNLFVFAALVFSGQLLDAHAAARALVAFAAFCLVSSAIYFFNDYRDINEDREHPVKRTRPLASGLLPRWVGVVGALTLGSVGLGLPAALLDRWAMVAVAAYLVINLGYSLGLKHLVIIDVLIIATGFLLRVLGGAAAVVVMPSTWLILCAGTISLFLGFAKRRAEVVLLNERAAQHRKVLAHYSAPFLDQMIGIVTAATLVLYILYTVDARTVELVGSHALVLSVPFVLYGIFRYLYLVYHTESAGDPTQTVFTDVPLLINGALWAGVCTAVILFGNGSLLSSF